ncbi:FAD-dependent oxidoreductase [Oceanospirillum maris]|uniref:FAD-dependent oxidoreductase n=1 Tax=Oceanospirillum maris TaxID=64977 RepID=UPI00042877CA|nr:bifunctional TVP38/TMEM64 family protein/FAD-dependent oxidoreductase [Oceanospirillum maris]
MKRIILLALLAAVVAAFFTFDLNQYLTLDSLKNSQEQLGIWQEEQPFATAAVFFLVYIAATALSLPGAVIMTLAVGAVFGLVWGLMLVSFASAIGATLAFLVARFVLRDSVQERFGDRLKAFNQGVEREGAFYLFTLRLVPVFPFFLINLLMGLTPIKTRTYYWVSQIGMLPGTLIYVNAGTQLGQLDSLSGIVSPEILLSFALLGVFPLIAKKIVALVKKRRVYKGFQKPAKFDRNLIVIGGGAAGLVSAYIAAAVKAKVTLIEANKMGGDCLNYGCIPSKALIKSAKVAEQMRHGDRYGLEGGEPQFSFKKVMQRIHDVIAAIEPHDSVERYTSLGVEVLQGYGKIIDPWTVEIQLNDGSSQRLTARSIVVAAGAKPFVPPIEGLDQVGYLTSDTLWEELAKEDDIPKRMVLLGGGPIGCELAQSFARLGSNVIQVERNERVMVREDPEVSVLAANALRKSGVNLLTGYEAIRCQFGGDNQSEKQLIVKNPDGEEEIIAFDRLICAVGRTARLTGYGLENLGIQTERTVVTNEYLETLFPNIYAAGDVAGPFEFTHTAAHQAWYAAVNALFGEWKSFKVDYSVIPWATFIDPEVARVGLSETEAREKNIPFEVTRYGLDDLDRAIADSSTEGFVKVLTVPGKDKILGVTIVGTHAGDLLVEYVLAMKHGLGLSKILGTIHTYPTLAEANKFAAGEWKKAHAPEKLLLWIEKYHRWKRG